ncbi:MAG: 3'(2'),5'-bisphosphate nucleotidase CysQ [Cytophagales bacterium]|nr:3'(2'),5'-bisphosphate nucleotidase CysQ [Bernardetiaceae bacterium]MDW8205445.1 3'(2'),5'-bisphosphate nucleotidase CysQ [Cytophagales bacterium]
MPESSIPFVNIEALNATIIKAGQLIMQHYRSAALGIFHKSDRSPVTNADREAHQLICEHLQQLTPHFPILSEEGEPVSYTTRQTWETFWLVDPLDGTLEFIEQTGQFAVCIGLIHCCYPVIGAIYLPVMQTLFFANGKQTFKLNANGTVMRLQLPAEPLHNPLRAVYSKGKMPERDARFFSNLGISQIDFVGSAIKYCTIAEGQADIFYRSRANHEWDSAAGQAIIEQAGGHVLNLDGERFAYNKSSLVNPPFVCLGFSNKSLIMRALQMANAW